MRTNRLTIFVFILACLVPAMFGQTATTGVVSGLVTDGSGAAVPGAAIELTNKALSITVKQTSNSVGQFILPNLAPGEYDVKVSAQGFRSTTISSFKVEVSKSYTLNVTLEVGQVTETVAVTAEARAELATVDSTIGNVINAKQLPYMPTFTRQLNELLTIQPGATPAGEVTGARRDQNTFSLDGIDVTNQSTGGVVGQYMYMGVEGTEEVRVGVANPNASFGRASGGQMALIGRRGSNQFHGAVFWYHQNDNMNANSWDRNRNRIRKPELKDNRFGGRIGGPIWKDKLYFFYNQEARRFPRASTIQRIVPTDTLRAGVLRFRDAANTVNSYNLRTSQACGASGTEACDPRGLGLSPTISSMWGLLPAGNDPSLGDGLNTIGYTGTVNHPIKDDFYYGRIDYNISQNWRLDSSFRYYRVLDQNNGSLDIRNGNIQSIRSFPNRQNLVSVGVSGSLKSNLLAEFRFGWNRVRPVTEVVRPSASSAILNLPGTNTPDGTIGVDVGALTGAGIATLLLSEPFDVDTQLARKQINNNRVWQFGGDLNWIKGKHTVQFGSKMRYLPTFHGRDDKVLGSLGSLVAQVDSTLGSLQLPSTVAPPQCGAGRTTGCLQAGDLQQYLRLYAGMTGMIDNVSVLATRDGNFKPLPFGDLLISDTFRLWAPEFYVQDVWKVTPNLTITAGLNYGWQNPPRERLGRYTIQQLRDGTDASSDDFFERRQAGALGGTLFNPDFQFAPVNSVKRDVFNIDWNNFAPRVAAAWNPSGKGGLLGKMFGERKTVIRGGYSLVFDRQNTVQSVIIPSLGVAFAQTLNVTTPLCNSTGAGGSNCAPNSANTAASNFRIGVDGVIPRPTVPTQGIPVQLPWGNLVNGRPRLYPETLSFQVDPNIKVGENHAFDFTIQRELPANHLLEVSWVGRYARNLPQSMNLTQPIYMHVDRASGQSFAQAFDNVAGVLRGGATSAPAQAWFENNVPGGTGALITSQRTNFVNGNLNPIWQTIDTLRLQNNLTPFNNYYAQNSLLRSSTGLSNYNAFILSLRKRMSKGVYYDFSYTFSRSLDQLGEWQNSASVTPDSFNLDHEYGPSLFDINHIANFIGSWDIPYKVSNKALGFALNGWSIQGIFTARSGDPLVFQQGSQVWGAGTFGGLAFASGMIRKSGSTVSTSTGVATNVTGSNNIGTNSNPAARGSGLNLFADPAAVYNGFRQVEISRDGRSGRSNPLRGLPRWNADLSLGKNTRFGGERGVTVRVSLDAFNIFNNVMFANPTLSFTNPRGFGVLTTQFVPNNRVDGSRTLQTGLRIEF